MTVPSTVITNIGELTTNEPSLGAGPGGRMTDAAVVIEQDRVAWVGAAAAAPAADERFDAEGRAVLPGWVDAHTHLVFAGDRTAEFEARMAGESYAAGGISVTVEATRAASDAELEANLVRLVGEARRGGTTTLETKTGYGLTVADEVRSAVVAGRHVDAVTFLGAHLVPPGSDPGSYLDLVTGPMLQAVAPHVSSVDVFCEQGAFDEAATRRMLMAARDAGLSAHVHGNQLGEGPGARLAVEHGALSVDHVGFLSDADIDALAGSWDAGSGTSTSTGTGISTGTGTGTGSGTSTVADSASEVGTGTGTVAGSASEVGTGTGGARGGARAGCGTVATVLPACDLSTRVPLAPARRLIDAGVEVAIASNCNPGTSYTNSMAFCVATAVLQMGLTVQEAVRAATLGGAIALDMHRDDWIDPRGVAQPRVGVVSPGSRADLQLLEAPSATHLAYRPGMPLTAAVWRKGERVV